jgi:4-hydroxy-2-oxoheptanedioate aldolase
MRPAMLEGFDYLQTANEQVACVVMIETEEGLKNVEAIATLLAACHRHGRAAGMFGYTAELAAQSLERGFTFASAGTDISFLRDGATRALAAAGGEALSSGGPQAGY